MKIHNKILGLAAAGAVAFTAVESANAVPTIQVKVGGVTVLTVTDGGAGDMSASAGSVLSVYSGPTFSLAISTLGTKPLDGSASDPVLSANVSFSSIGAGVLEVFFSEDAFGPSGVSLASSVTFNQGVGSGTYTGATFYDNADGLGEAGAVSLLASIGPVGLGTGQDAGLSSLIVQVPAGDPSYSLTGYLKIVTTGVASGDSDINIIRFVPDGGSTVAFLGMALVAVEGVRRKFAKA